MDVAVRFAEGLSDVHLNFQGTPHAAQSAGMENSWMIDSHAQG